MSELSEKVRIGVCLVLLWIGLIPVYATVEVRSERLTTADGLANNSIRYMYQDSKGFIWMATLNGLNRYDGNSFITFRPQKTSGISLADHRVKMIHEDRHGFLWITTSADLISCYDLKHDCFVDFTGCGEYRGYYREAMVLDDAVWLWGAVEGCRRIEYQEGKFVSQAFTEGNGSLMSDDVCFVRQVGDKIWIGTRKGAYYWKEGKLVAVDRTHSFWKALSHGRTVLLVSSEGELFRMEKDTLASVGRLPRHTQDWAMTGLFRIGKMQYVLTSEGTLEIDMETCRVRKASEYYDIPGGSSRKDNRGNYWIYNRSGRLYYIEAETGRKKEFEVMPPDKLGFIDKERYYIVHDSRDIIWISTYGNGLFAYDVKTENFQHFSADASSSGVLASNYLQCLMEDRSGSVWVSSEFAGLSKLDVLNEGAVRICPEKEEMYDRSNMIRMMSPASDGDIWIGTRSGGLYLYDSDLKVQKERHYSDINTYAMHEDRAHRKWIATRGKGLTVDGVSYQNDKSDPRSLSRDNVFCLLEDRKGRMWIGTFGGGLNLAVRKEDGKYEFRHFINQTNAQKETRALCEDRNGWIWAGTSEGVFVFHPDSLIRNPKAYKHYSFDNGRLESNDIRAIIQDRQGRMWIAQSGYGLCMAIVGKGYGQVEFTHYTLKDGLVSMMVQALVEDGEGMIWVSTEYGLSCFDPDLMTFKNFLFSNSILGNVYSENSALCLADGRLAFGSGQGIVVVDPRQASAEEQAPHISFTDLRLGGLSVRPGDPDSPLESSLAYADEIRLSYHQNSFTVAYSTFEYAESDLLKYMYRLEGYEKSWSVPESLPFASYKNLPPGTYSLRVKACNAAGVWGDESVLKIIIVPPFWQTSWAFLVYFLLGLLALYIAYRIVGKMNSLRNKIKVEEQLTEYKLMFFTNISHEFRTPLTLILGALERMHRVKKVPAELSRSIRLMDKSTQRMLRLINQLLEFRKMQNNKLSLALEEADVIAFLNDICSNFTEAAQSKRMDFAFVPSCPSYRMFIDKSYLDKIAYNLLSNAFKYTPSGGRIQCIVTIDEPLHKLILKVTDTGVGVPVDKRDELFKRFMQSSFSGSSMGVGLHLTHELVQVHKGTIMYEENPGGGSIFTVTLPTDASVYEEKDFLVPNTLLEEEAEVAERQHSLDRIEDEAGEEEEASPLNKRKVLVVEDDNDVREFLKEELSPYFEVRAEADGNAGLECVKTFDADLIISDVLMPGCSGFELTKKLKNDFNTSHIPIILLTALNTQDKHLEGVEAGADAYITKPFSSSLLRARVFKLIEQRDKLREKFSKDPQSVRPSLCSTDKDKDFADKLAKTLESHLSDPDFTIDDFVLKMKMGRTIFYRKVRGVTGYSPNEYIRVMRMKKAAELLAEGEYTVSEVAYKVGMNDPFYFSKCFKAQFGVAPSAYSKGEEGKEGGMEA